EKSKLLCTYSLKNLSDSVMPYSFGLHPGFNLFCENGADIEDYILRFDTPFITSHKFDGFAQRVGTRLDTPEGLHRINEQEIYSNDTLILSDMGSRVSLFNEKSTHRIDLEFSDNFKHFCVWKCPSHDAKYLCLEPWTTIPTDPVGDECFDTRYGMLRLFGGEDAEFTLNINFCS
ncbi:MAG: hypothetical protein IIX96_02050, partial [Clostridia bacterium]|nr:hypothetical protein [Clostridia bacterium]